MLEVDENLDTIETLEDIANLQPGRNAQLAAKKISKKYREMREALAKKKKFKIPGEIVKIETIETPQGNVKVPVSIEKTNRSGKETANKIIEKYDKIRQPEKRF